MLELPSHDDMERIHSAAAEILEGISVMMPHEKALEILKGSGAEIHVRVSSTAANPGKCFRMSVTD